MQHARVRQRVTAIAYSATGDAALLEKKRKLEDFVLRRFTKGKRFVPAAQEGLRGVPGLLGAVHEEARGLCDGERRADGRVGAGVEGAGDLSAGDLEDARGKCNACGILQEQRHLLNKG